MAVPKGETSLILTLGQIQVGVSLFYATSKKADAKQVTIPVFLVSTQSLDKWTVAEVLKDEFTHNQSQQQLGDTIDTTQLENDNYISRLSADFLAYVAESIAEDQSTHARTALLMFKYFPLTYLVTRDTHSLASTFDTDSARLSFLRTSLLSLPSKRASSPMLSVAGLTLKELQPPQQDKPSPPSYLPASCVAPQ